MARQHAIRTAWPRPSRPPWACPARKPLDPRVIDIGHLEEETVKQYPADRIRNIGLFAHGGAGKTSLTEACLFTSKTTTRLGKVGNPNQKPSFPAARSTPTVVGDVLFALGSDGDLACVGTKDGKIRWQKNLRAEFDGKPGVWAYSESPLVDGDAVVCSPGGTNATIIALNKKTGKEVWRVERPIQGSWATPVIVKVGNRTEMVTSGNEFLISYDPATGKELWRASGLRSHAIATPVIGHGLAILSSGYPSKVITAIKLGASGNLDKTENIAWTYNKGTAYVPSPILYGDYLYLMNDQGALTCLEAKTGKVVYEGGRVPVNAKFYGASPVAFDDKILLTNDDGETFVIKAGPKHEVLGTNSIDEPCRTSIAIADGKLFIRGDKHLYCIGKKG